MHEWPRYTADGQKVTLDQLVRLDPEWAASRIRAHEAKERQPCPSCMNLRTSLEELRQMDRGFSPRDTEDDYTPTIQRLPPMNLPDGGGKRLVLAERLVHNRSSKWALVYLVHALLHERDEAQARSDAAASNMQAVLAALQAQLDLRLTMELGVHTESALAKLREDWLRAVRSTEDAFHDARGTL